MEGGEDWVQDNGGREKEEKEVERVRREGRSGAGQGKDDGREWGRQMKRFNMFVSLL